MLEPKPKQYPLATSKENKMSAKGEMYKSAKMKKKHEMKEGASARMKEYGSKTGGMSAKKAVKKKK